MSFLRRESTVKHDTHISEERLEQLASYSSSDDSNGFDRTGTVVQKDPKDEEMRYIRQTGPAAVPETSPASAVRTEMPSFDPIRSENGHQETSYLWPGELQLQSGERPALEPETAVNSIPYGTIAKNGLKKAIDSLKSFKEDAADAYYMANVRLAETRDKVMNALTSPEYKKNRRAVLAIGTVAVAAAGAYFAYKGLIAPSGNSANHAHETAGNAVQHHTAAKETVPSNQPHAKKVQATAAHIHKASKHLQYQTEHLKYAGDTIWYHAQSKMQAALGHKPSAAELNEYVKRTLKFNHLSWESARHMFKGQTFKLPSIHR